jgi:hypothetical protein
MKWFASLTPLWRVVCIVIAICFLQIIAIVRNWTVRPLVQSPAAEDMRLLRYDITTLSNAAAARDPVAVFLAVEKKVSIPIFAQDKAWLRRDVEPMIDYLDAESAVDEISASLTKTELEHAGMKDSSYEGHSPLSPVERVALYQRIELDCARALATFPQ